MILFSHDFRDFFAFYAFGAETFVASSCSERGRALMVASLALRFLVALSVVLLLSLLLVASLALRLLVVALSEVSRSRCSWWLRSRFASWWLRFPWWSCSRCSWWPRSRFASW